MDNIYKTTVKNLESKQNLKDFVDGLPQYINMCVMIAKGQKVYYEELMKEGFTEDQAIKIVMAHGAFPGRIGGQVEEKNSK